MLYIVVMIFIDESRVGRGLDVMVTPLEVLVQVGMRLGMVVGDSTIEHPQNGKISWFWGSSFARRLL